jgi:type IV pilus assembly protein PilA
MNSTPNLFVKNLLLARQKQKDGNEGFTLVELMIVIVIVGILSAVALPNFLNQTGKAKATEAITKVSALLKEGYTEYQYDSDADNANTALKASITKADSAGNFRYESSVADGILSVKAEGNDNDSTLEGKYIFGCINLVKGDPNVSKKLVEADSTDVSCL